MNDFFIQYGYWGMALASFLAGTFVPFSSEAVMGGLLAATDMHFWPTVLAGTAGNVLGSMVNYFIGTFASMEKIGKWLRVKPQQLRRAIRWTDRYGAWMGFFAFLPILGTAISIALGIARANLPITFLSTLVGKFLRYLIVAYSVVSLL